MTGLFPTLYRPLIKIISELTLMEYAELTHLLKEVTIFFEVCGRLNKHKLLYDWEIDYLIFDGWDNKEGKYIPSTVKRLIRIRELLHMKRVEILFDIKTYKDAYEWLLKQKGGLVEGVVLKNYITGDRCKILHPGNSELESSMFTKKRSTPNYMESKFLHRYVTMTRIRKIYHKIVKREDVEGMRAMGMLLGDLYKDLIEECLAEFVYNERPNGMDFKYIKKHMPEIAKGIFMVLVQEWKK